MSRSPSSSPFSTWSRPAARSTLLVLAGLLVLLGWIPSARAQTMEVEIAPPSANVLPTARIDIRVTFTGPVSNASVTVDPGSNPGSHDLGQSFTASFGSGVSSGQVRFVNPTGSMPTEVGVIRIFPDGTLDGNCQTASGFTNVQSYPISLTVQGENLDTYTLTSYRAPSDVACSADFDRNTNAPAGAKWVSTPSTGTEIDRLPIDVALVLDKSGSMLGSAGSKSKIEVLKEGANQFLDNWRGLYGPSSDPEAQADDFFGTVFFESSVDPVTVGSNFYVRRTDAAPGSSTHPWAPFTGAIDGRNAGGLTAMGDGMRRAFAEFDDLAEARDASQDRAMIVLTDGMQNQGNEVHTCADFQNGGEPGACGGGTADGTVYALREHGSSSAPITTLPNRGTVIQTVYIGPPGSTVAELMSGIAEQNGGMLNGQQVPRYDPTATTGTNPDFGFIQELMSVLTGFTPEIVLREADTGGGTHPFVMTRTADHVVATLNWLDVDRRRALEVDLVGPSGTVVDPDVRFDRQGYSVVAVDLRGRARPGRWTARVRPGASEEASYQLTVVAEDASFASELGFRTGTHFTGGDLVLELQLTSDGEPVTDVGAIEGRVLRPKAGLGTILHEREPQRRPDLPEDQLTSPYSRKLYALYESEEVQAMITPTPAETIRLVDDGSSQSGDAAADDGIYTAELTDVEVPGTYRFEVNLAFETEEVGPVRRTKTAETVVEVRPTLGASDVRASGPDELTMLPRDRFGNYIGPGYSRKIQLRTPDGDLIPSEVTNEAVDGRYAVQIPEPPPLDESFHLTVNGYEFEETTLEELGARPGGDDGVPDDTTGDGSDQGDLNPCTGRTVNGLLIAVGVVLIGFVTYRRRRRDKD